MNKSYMNNAIIINSANIKNTIINGVEYPWVNGMKGNSITTINNKVFIDGYELKKNGKWKITLRAVVYSIF